MNPYLAVRTLGMNRKSILANLSSFLFVIRKQFPPLVTVRNYFVVAIFINEPDQLSLTSAPKVPCFLCEFDDSFSKIIVFSRRNVICHNRAVLWKLTQKNKGKKLVTWSYKCKKDCSPYPNSVQFTSAEICLWIQSGMCWTSTIAELRVLYHTKQLPACLSICLFDMIDSLKNFCLRAICFHNLINNVWHWS